MKENDPRFLLKQLRFCLAGTALFCAFATADTPDQEADGLLITGTNRIAFPIRTERSTTMTALTGRIGITASVTSRVLIMLNIHEDQDGRPGAPIAHITRDIPRDRTATTETTLQLPEPIALRAGVQYWVMVDSPSGAELTWATTPASTMLFEQDLLSGDVVLREHDQPHYSLDLVDDLPAPQPDVAPRDPQSVKS